MFARPNAQHSQIAYVTNDIMAAAALLQERYGGPGFHHMSNIGVGMDSEDGPQLKIALARVNGVEVELIEPIGDTAPLFRDVLPDTTELAIRFHHVAIRIDGPESNWQAHVASLDLDRHPIVFQGSMGEHLRFFYTDEREALGHYVEHVWMSEALYARMTAETPTYPGAIP